MLLAELWIIDNVDAHGDGVLCMSEHKVIS